MSRPLREWAVRLLSVVLVLLAWQLYAPHVNPIFLRPPSQVVSAFMTLASDGALLSSSERRLWLDVLLPASLPFIFAGIRLAVPRALVGMVLAEFLISVGGGLGSLIIVYQNTFRVDRMFVPVIVVAFMGVVLIAAVQWLEGRLAPWARRDR